MRMPQAVAAAAVALVLAVAAVDCRLDEPKLTVCVCVGVWGVCVCQYRMQ